MSKTCLVLPSIGSLLLAATLAAAQPTPATRPPQPQDPTPVPETRPPITKPPAKPAEPAPSGRLSKSEATFRGCIQRAPEKSEAAGNARGEAATLSAGYVLTHATTMLTRSPEGAAQSSKEYRLMAKDDSIKLADHVGHQVEVVGRLSIDAAPPEHKSTDAATSSSRPSGSTGVATVPETGRSVTPQVTLMITSLKSIAPSCTTATQ